VKALNLFTFPLAIKAFVYIEQIWWSHDHIQENDWRQRKIILPRGQICR